MRKTMNCDKVLAINDDVVTISALSCNDHSTRISVHFYKVDTVETGLVLSGVPVTCNIAQRCAVVHCCAEIVEIKTGLCRYFLLCGPDRLHGSASENRSLWLYTVDNREIIPFVEFRLPSGLQTRLSELSFEILDGPTVCFVVQSDVYVATSDGTVQIYPTGANGMFRRLASWVQDDSLLVTGWSASGQIKSGQRQSPDEPAMLTLFINTSKQLFGCSYDALMPDVYIGM